MKLLLFLILAAGIAFLLYDRSKILEELQDTRAKLELVESQLKVAQEVVKGNPATARVGPSGSASTEASRQSPDWFNNHLNAGRDRMNR